MDQKEIRELALKRVHKVIEKQDEIDKNLDSVMEGWRLKRLPRIDRDILRLAFVDLTIVSTGCATGITWDGVCCTIVIGSSGCPLLFLGGDLMEIFTPSNSKSTSVAPDFATNFINS